MNGFKKKDSIISLCLWKDRLYEDWGFSLVDEEEEEDTDNANQHNIQNQNQGGTVHQIRPGGPAYLAGLKRGDKLLKVSYHLSYFIKKSQKL